MGYEQINPATGESFGSREYHSEAEIESVLNRARDTYSRWRKTSFADRARLFRTAAQILRDRCSEFAEVMVREMGKPIAQAEGEVEKCALGCDFYALNAERFLTPEDKTSDASKSYIRFDPLGVVLTIMPWNFPFWQVFRFAAPALMAGNTAILKHASNVPECAEKIVSVFEEAGFPEGVFQNLFISGARASELVGDSRIAAVTLTGSEDAGRSVASAAGKAIKPTVLELGGSDPFIVLDDADVQAVAEFAVKGRAQNSGQSCIAAKRFVVMASVHDAFVDAFVDAFGAVAVGDPMEPGTGIGPLARQDLVDDLHQQVTASIEAGATAVLGGSPVEGAGSFYPPTILTGVGPGMPAYEEELFGPAAAVICASDEAEAIRIANDTPYGLGASIWTADSERGERVAAEIEAGNVFVNGNTKSDPRIPFGGIKLSGYGRELSDYGIREFVNIKTVWVK
jgi:succinate-semialdehyde dehydrogenase/glutarate-semialdehyde dehydrogenase